jgi:integrase
MSTGIRKLHSKGCPGRDGGRCRCGAGWEASVFSKRDGKKVRKTFVNKAEAKTWRDDASTMLAKGGLRAPKPTTVREAWNAWYEGAIAGTIRNRSGDRFKPSTLRSHEQAMRRRVLPELGRTRLADVARADLQCFADELVAAGLNASTLAGTVQPLRLIFGHAVHHGELAVNPCNGLRLPAVRSRRERVAGPAEAAALIAAVPERDRAFWATAMYAGLRLGELQALRVEDIDMAAGIIRIERGRDAKEGMIELKSRAGRRRVPILAGLRDLLLDHLARTGLSGSDLIFGRTAQDPLDSSTVQGRADRAWRDAGLERITPHGCRHSYGSILIAAGVNAKAIQTFMGHSSITVTYDIYGHLLPGSEAEAASLADAYLAAQIERGTDKARSADPLHDPCPSGERPGERNAATARTRHNRALVDGPRSST